MTGESLYPRDLIERLRAKIDDHEAWARAASRTYEYADEGATVPEGGVHWRWVHGDNWDTTNPDPGVEEWVGGEPGAPVHLVTVEQWPVSYRRDDGTVIRTRSAPLSYANEIVEMDPAAAGLIQRYDPAHVLRTIQAHRTITDEFTGAADWADTLRAEGKHAESDLYARYAGAMLTAVHALASIYFPESDATDG